MSALFPKFTVQPLGVIFWVLMFLGLSPLTQAATWTEKGGTLSADPQGWASTPSIATGQNGALYAVWAQHRNAAVWEHESPHAAVFTSGGWQPLGGRIGSAQEGFAPTITVLGNTPYVAWYEGAGPGWGTANGTYVVNSIFVSHWDGSQWVQDLNSGVANGALNTSASHFARHPFVTVINGVLYASWIEMRGVGSYVSNDVVVVKHLSAGQWIQDGAELSSVGSIGSKINDVAMIDVGGVPYLAWSEFKRTYNSAGFYNSPGTVQVYRLSAGSWVQVGGTLNVSPQGYANYLAITSQGGAPYVVWQERSASGKNQLYVKHWNGSAWIQDGGSLNVDPVNGEAGRPSLSSDGSSIWAAWSEGAAGQKSQTYVRYWNGSSWSAAEGTLNVDPVNGSAEKPTLTVSGGIVQVAWAERHFPSATKQIYVKGRDTLGVPIANTLTRFGSDGPAVTMLDNTWINLHPGGIANTTNGVGDETYDSFHYDPGIKKALVYGNYHAIATSYGEDQNALMGYDFARNRWDLVETGEAAWSEFLPGCGHDEGNSTVDTLHDLYITHGNLTLNSGTLYKTFVYDLKAGRGQRMMPTTEIIGTPRTDTMASAFDPDHDLMLEVGPSSSWFYDHNANVWTEIPNSPLKASATLIYDTKNHLFVMFGGGSNETWVLDPVSKIWTKRTPVAAPPSYAYPYLPFMAYDSANGVTLLIGGNTKAVWIYDAGVNAWTRIADAPAGVPTNQVDGLYLTYDSDDQVFLVRDGVDLANLWAFRYVPSGTPPDTTPPVVSSIAVTSITTQSATITWTSNELADSQVEYGLTASYGSQTAINTSLVTAHSVPLSGLLANTLYHFRVKSKDFSGNLATSTDATFTTTASSTAPTITTQPGNQAVTDGQTATFTVAASGTATLSYQWQKNGVTIAGAMAASYTTPSTTTADNGALFSVVVTNSAGSATSANATLTVSSAGTSGGTSTATTSSGGSTGASDTGGSSRCGVGFGIAAFGFACFACAIHVRRRGSRCMSL